MNIATFAASRGKSKQRVYQMIKEAGLKVSDLTDGQGQITEFGLEKLNEIVPDKVTVPEGESETEQSSGSAEKQTKEKTKESEIERLTRQNELLLENVNSLTDTIKGLREDLSKAQKIADQAQQLHAIDKQRILDLTKRLEAGSPEGESEKPIPADIQEEQSPETTESETVKTDPEGESLEEKKQDPEKTEGETAPSAESSSPVTTDQKQEQKPEQKPEEKTKATLKQRFRFLFHGE